MLNKIRNVYRGNRIKFVYGIEASTFGHSNDNTYTHTYIQFYTLSGSQHFKISIDEEAKHIRCEVVCIIKEFKPFFALKLCISFTFTTAFKNWKDEIASNWKLCPNRFSSSIICHAWRMEKKPIINIWWENNDIERKRKKMQREREREKKSKWKKGASEQGWKR